VSGDAAWRNGSLSTALDAGFQGVNLVSGVASDLATYARGAHGGLRGRWDVDSVRRVEWGTLALIERQRYRLDSSFHFGDNVQTSSRLGCITGARPGECDHRRVTFNHLSRAAT
jgi:hypothetical protein